MQNSLSNSLEISSSTDAFFLLLNNVPALNQTLVPQDVMAWTRCFLHTFVLSHFMAYWWITTRPSFLKWGSAILEMLANFLAGCQNSKQCVRKEETFLNLDQFGQSNFILVNCQHQKKQQLDHTFRWGPTIQLAQLDPDHVRSVVRKSIGFTMASQALKFRTHRCVVWLFTSLQSVAGFGIRRTWESTVV